MIISLSNRPRPSTPSVSVSPYHHSTHPRHHVPQPKLPHSCPLRLDVGRQRPAQGRGHRSRSVHPEISEFRTRSLIGAGSGGLAAANQVYNLLKSQGKTLNDGDIAIVDVSCR